MEQLARIDWRQALNYVQIDLGGVMFLAMAWALATGNSSRTRTFARRWGLPVTTATALFRPSQTWLVRLLSWLAAAPLAVCGLVSFAFTLTQRPGDIMIIVPLLLLATPLWVAFMGLQMLLAAPAVAYGRALNALSSSLVADRSIAAISAAVRTDPKIVRRIRLNGLIFLGGAAWIGFMVIRGGMLHDLITRLQALHRA
ncbi:MAG: hypothetical protein WDN06_03360 [Asticcacaulis sp.]